MKNHKRIHTDSRLTQQGFTLMEILVVVSIISILSTLGVLNWKNVIDRSKRTATMDEVREYGQHEGIARGDTGIFWRLQDLQMATMPNEDVYGRQINSEKGFSINVDSTLWKGPYLSLQKTAGSDNRKRFDAQGYPLDLYGNRYYVTLLKVEGSTTTLMDLATERPDITMIVSWGKDQRPGNAMSGISFSQKSAQYWLYYDEPGSDDVYYFF
jgi:prepilin-type N-terminal cleavage/methylation domain-containing protein